MTGLYSTEDILFFVLFPQGRKWRLSAIFCRTGAVFRWNCRAIRFPGTLRPYRKQAPTESEAGSTLQVQMQPAERCMRKAVPALTLSALCRAPL